jgi:hypothetical protein
MMNERKTLYALVGLFAGLLALVFLQTRLLSAPTLPATSNGTPIASLVSLYDWRPETIQALVIEVRDIQPLQLQRQGELWISPNSPQSINQESVNDVALTLSELPVIDLFDGIEPDRYGEFGLSRVDYLMIIQLVLQDGTPHALIIGNRTEDEQGYYALVDDRPQIYVLGRGAIEFLAFAVRSTQP